MRFAVVGAGMLGLTLAWKLRREGHDVDVIEAAPTVGGLVCPQDFGEFVWDRYYHCILPHDSHLLSLLAELGLSNDLRWTRTGTGYFTDGRLHDMSGMADYLRFPLLSAVDKARLGAAISEADPALPLEEQARHYWSQAMAWMQAHPRELRFVLGFFHSPLLARPLRSQILGETLPFLPRLLALGQACGELTPAPPVLMLEVCQSQFLTCASLFVDQPELGEDPHWRESAFSLFWSAIAGGRHAR